MASKETQSTSMEAINADEKLTVFVELLLQKFPSIDPEFVFERLKNANDLFDEFLQILNEMKCQTVHDNIMEMTGFKNVLELLSTIKAERVDKSGLQAQIDRIKSVLPMDEYSYDIDVINSRLQASLDVAVEADVIINEILNNRSEEELHTLSENSNSDMNNDILKTSEAELVAEYLDSGIGTAAEPSFSLQPITTVKNEDNANLDEQTHQAVPTTYLKPGKPEVACRNKISKTVIRNLQDDGVKGQKVTITKTQKMMGHEKLEKTQTSSSANACTYKPIKMEITETWTDRDVTDESVSLDYVEDDKPMKENFVLTEEDERSFLRLYDMYPDIDPVYLTEIMFREKVDIQGVVDEFSVTGYPTLRDRLHVEQRDRRRRILLSNTFTEANMNEMLLIYNNDPKGYFFDVDRVVSDSYKKYCMFDKLVPSYT